MLLVFKFEFKKKASLNNWTCQEIVPWFIKEILYSQHFFKKKIKNKKILQCVLTLKL